MPSAPTQGRPCHLYGGRFPPPAAVQAPRAPEPRCGGARLEARWGGGHLARGGLHDACWAGQPAGPRDTATLPLRLVTFLMAPHSPPFPGQPPPHRRPPAAPSPAPWLPCGPSLSCPLSRGRGGRARTARGLCCVWTGRGRWREAGVRGREVASAVLAGPWAPGATRLLQNRSQQVTDLRSPCGPSSLLAGAPGAVGRGRTWASPARSRLLFPAAPQCWGDPPGEQRAGWRSPRVSGVLGSRTACGELGSTVQTPEYVQWLYSMGRTAVGDTF